MKKILLIVSVLLVQLSFSQTMTKDELVSKLADDACECSSKEKITKENFEMVLGLCILQGVSKYKSDVAFYYGENIIGNDKAIETLGEEIGIKLATNCPAFVNAILDTGVEKYMDGHSAEDEIVKGKFKKVTSDQFLTMELAEDSGKKHELIVLHDFDNAFLVTDNVLKTNAEITVSYYLLEIYDTKTKKFVTYKVISDITKD